MGLRYLLFGLMAVVSASNWEALAHPPSVHASATGSPEQPQPPSSSSGSRWRKFLETIIPSRQKNQDPPVSSTAGSGASEVEGPSGEGSTPEDFAFGGGGGDGDTPAQGSEERLSDNLTGDTLGEYDEHSITSAASLSPAVDYTAPTGQGEGPADLKEALALIGETLGEAFSGESAHDAEDGLQAANEDAIHSAEGLSTAQEEAKTETRREMGRYLETLQDKSTETSSGLESYAAKVKRQAGRLIQMIKEQSKRLVASAYAASRRIRGTKSQSVDTLSEEAGVVEDVISGNGSGESGDLEGENQEN